MAQEYPIRLLSHRRAGEDALTSVRALWPLLATAIVSAAIAYLAFFASGVTGLRQLAVFTITGLLVAGFSTRYVLPHVLPSRFRDAADIAAVGTALAVIDRVPRPAWLPWLLAAVALVVLWRAPGPMWENDLAALTPVPEDLLLRDAKLRGELGAPDVRYLLVLRASDPQHLLELSENLEPRLDALVKQHALDAAELPSRYLPSLATQRARQAKLPDRATLAAALGEASRDLPFRADLFAPFLDDVETARTLRPIDVDEFERAPFGARLASMLVRFDKDAVSAPPVLGQPASADWLALATLSGVHDPGAIEAFAASSDTDSASVRLLDLKGAAESLVDRLSRTHPARARHRTRAAGAHRDRRAAQCASRLARARADDARDAARSRRRARRRAFRCRCSISSR